MLLAVLGMLFLPCSCAISNASKKPLNHAAGLRHPRVAVVGAGMAGLSTAKRLNEIGISDVDVFEALDRLGGRIHSVPYQGGYLQHGAQFINGDQNPIYDIAKSLGVVSKVIGDLEHLEKSRFLYGTCDVDLADLDLFTKFTEPLDPKYRDIAHNDDLISHLASIYDVYQRDYQKFLKDNNITGHRKDVFDALSLSFRSYWEFEWASDWKDQSLRNLADWDDKGDVGVSYLTDKIGYKGVTEIRTLEDVAHIDLLEARKRIAAIIQYVASQMGKARLHLNTPVSNIRYDDDRGVWITLANGTVVETPYDYVVVTVSLGHLKKYHQRLFTPPVGKFKKRVIEHIGFGGSTKVYFRWTNPFWSEHDSSLVTLSVRGCDGKEEVDAFDSEITTLQPLDWDPKNTLVAWIAGRGQTLFDNMSDEEVMLKTTTLVRRLFNNDTIEPPEMIMRSKLTKNEFLLGSYSYVSVAQARARIHHADLSHPLRHAGRPRVLMAGEATHHRLFETAIGAFLSGRREVDRLADDWLLLQVCASTDDARSYEACVGSPQVGCRALTALHGLLLTEQPELSPGCGRGRSEVCERPIRVEMREK